MYKSIMYRPRRHLNTASLSFSCVSPGLLVADAEEAYKASTANGAKGGLEPMTLKDEESGQQLVISEVGLYGDVVLR